MHRVRYAILLATAAPAACAPCDIFAADGAPCVAAHSLTRALFDAYTGRLYQVTRTSDNATLDVMVGQDGVANGGAQDAFCGSAPCFVTRIYDQTSRGNHLGLGPPGGAAPTQDRPINASALSVMARTHKVYAGYFTGGNGYRNDTTTGVATGNAPETLYMVTSGVHVNGGCCFDYGNAETDAHDHGPGTMEAVYFGTSTGWGRGAGSGPWVMADLEDGLWAGDQRVNLNNTALTSTFVTAMVKGATDGFTLKGGDATSVGLTTMYSGQRPAGYQPMKKQGALILGIGGDNSDWAIGTFLEGAVTAGVTSDAADEALQADIVAVGYMM